MQAFALVQPGGDWHAGDAFIAGGTDLLQLMKNDVVAPTRLTDLEHLDLRRISIVDSDLHLGALATMAEVAAHPDIIREWPVISQALLLSASPQVRNMGTVGGNLLQRTRCGYFRDVGFNCNKRLPGSGCPALLGDNRDLAIFGGSAQCIATHPSDLPVALMALDAQLDLVAPGGGIRRVPLAQFYRLPGTAPDIETALQPGEMIIKVVVPSGPHARNSVYVKVRDRTSFAFALVASAVCLAVTDGVIGDVRIALGGVGPMPWRLPQVEASLRGQRADAAAFARAAARAGDGATATRFNKFKVELARRTVLRALQTVAIRNA